jgi:hypothetical protein
MRSKDKAQIEKSTKPAGSTSSPYVGIFLGRKIKVFGY